MDVIHVGHLNGGSIQPCYVAPGDGFETKPFGTMIWASSAEADHAWFRCFGNEYIWERVLNKPRWLLTLAPSARVLTIASTKDFSLALQRFGIPAKNGMLKGTQLLDWGAVAKEYDAFHLTDEGIEELHYTWQFNDWDAETVVVFNHTAIRHRLELPPLRD